MPAKFEVLGPEHVGMYDHSEHDVVSTMLERFHSGKERGQFADGKNLAFASEGGGFSGVVPGGGLTVMEQTGLVRVFDQAIGTSAGAFNAAGTAAEQAAEGLMNYIDLLAMPFARQARLLGGRAPANYDHLIRDIMIAKRPYDPVKLARGPKVGAVVVNLATREVELLQDFDDIPDMLLALRASSSIPIVAGPPIEYKGKLMTDGGVIEAVPYKAALQNGATHVLALRSSGEDYRKLPEREATLRLIQRHRWGGKVLAELVRERPRAYNEDAENLQAGRMYPNVLQIALAGEQRPVERLTKLELEVKNGVQLGVDAMGEALGTPRLYVTWNEDKPVILTNPEATY